MELIVSPSVARRLDGARRGRQAISADPTITPRKNRSRVTNGKSLFVELDGRSPWTRRFRDIYDLIIDDIKPADGRLSEGQRQLARRAATIAIACEKLEGTAAAGEDIDLETYGKLTDRLGRAFQRLGLKRIASNNGPSLGDVLRAGIERDRRHD